MNKWTTVDFMTQLAYIWKKNSLYGSLILVLIKSPTWICYAIKRTNIPQESDSKVILMENFDICRHQQTGRLIFFCYHICWSLKNIRFFLVRPSHKWKITAKDMNNHFLESRWAIRMNYHTSRSINNKKRRHKP